MSLPASAVTGTWLAVLVAFSLLHAAEPVTIEVDFAKPAGEFRALHGINKGPLAPGGLIDLTPELRALGVPLVRLHDCHWPNPDVVDIHAVFPDFSADPERAESYDFRLTDEYLQAVRATGAQMIYRLGESIEHTSVQRFVHPPPDPEKWAAICAGIIRHCNDGWAGGHHFGIRYWEIWNEPENRPVCWTGTDAEYFRLYATAARTLKARFPELQIGGPAVGALGGFDGAGRFQPTEFVSAFLDFCRRENAPLDFFSWHCYSADPGEFAARAKAVRAMLDTRGFAKTESHLNEWNYLPDNSWKGVSGKAEPPARQRFYERMAGAEGAAFLASALIALQDAPVDVCTIFHGELGGFGLFNEHGVPQKNYHALSAFHSLLDTPRRVEVRGAIPGKLAVAAGLDAGRRKAQVLISNFALPADGISIAITNLPWRGKSTVEVRVVDAAHALEWQAGAPPLDSDAPFVLSLAAPGVVLVTLTSAAASTP